MKRYLWTVVFILMVTLIMGYGCASQSQGEEQLKTATLQIQKALQTELDSLNRDVSAASANLSKTGLSGPEARQILNALCSKHSYIIDSCTANNAGKMVTVVPEAYSRYEGSDISKQDPTIKFYETRKPTLSQVFRAIEGFDAVVLMWPVLSEKGDLIGSVSVLFKPETLFTTFAEPAAKGTDIEIISIQPDGLTIYTTDLTEVGKNLFTDPLYQPYKDLIALGKRIAVEEYGSGGYTFPSHSGGQTVKKQAYWVSVNLHGTAWRVASVAEANK